MRSACKIDLIALYRDQCSLGTDFLFKRAKLKLRLDKFEYAYILKEKHRNEYCNYCRVFGLHAENYLAPSSDVTRGTILRDSFTELMQG